MQHTTADIVYICYIVYMDVYTHIHFQVIVHYFVEDFCLLTVFVNVNKYIMYLHINYFLKPKQKAIVHHSLPIQ